MDHLAGFGFLAATTASALMMANGLRKGTREQAMFGALGLFLSRSFDLTMSTDEAAQRAQK